MGGLKSKVHCLVVVFWIHYEKPLLFSHFSIFNSWPELYNLTVSCPPHTVKYYAGLKIKCCSHNIHQDICRGSFLSFVIFCQIWVACLGLKNNPWAQPVQHGWTLEVILFHSLHSADEETKAQERWWTCPPSYSWWVLGLRPCHSTSSNRLKNSKY